MKVRQVDDGVKMLTHLYNLDSDNQFQRECVKYAGGCPAGRPEDRPHGGPAEAARPRHGVQGERVS